MEERLSNLPDLGFEEEPPERIVVALMTFAFDNAELINLLKRRGEAIKWENFNRMRAINEHIDKLKSRHLEQYNRPVSAFLTFENEEGLNRCLNYNETVMDDNSYAEYRTLLGEPVLIEEASEPTDIIWENRRFTAWDRFIRTCLVILVVGVILSLSFVVIFRCSQEASKPLLKYPSLNCTDIEVSQGKYFKDRAFAEWDRNFDEDGEDEIE